MKEARIPTVNRYYSTHDIVEDLNSISTESMAMRLTLEALGRTLAQDEKLVAAEEEFESEEISVFYDDDFEE